MRRLPPPLHSSPLHSLLSARIEPMMRRVMVPLVIPVLIAFTSRVSAQRCDVHYRWQQKIDDTRLTDVPTHTTVASMLRWPVPSFSAASIFWCQARNAREQRVYEVSAWARRLKVESGASGDGDWHIELTGSKTGSVANCVVIEIPPEAVNAAYGKARQNFLKAADDAGATIAQNGDVVPPVRIIVTGLPFFDGEHRGAGSNAPTQHGRCNSNVNALWEIHPVYSVRPR
jgi:hypothetical protein